MTAFTCAECGVASRFAPDKPHPCAGCGKTRWILGVNVKLSEWKAALATLRRSDRSQIAEMIRRESGALAADTEDPITIALLDVQQSGYAAASDLQECGHPLAARRDGVCASCQREREIIYTLEQEKLRADSVAVEIGTWMQKADAAGAALSGMTAKMELTQADFENALAKIAEMEPAAAKCEKLTDQLAAVLSTLADSDRERTVLQRDLEGMFAATARAVKAESARAVSESRLADALSENAELRRAKDEGERQLRDMNLDVKRHGEKIKDLGGKLDGGIAHVLEMKRTHAGPRRGDGQDRRD